MICECGPEFETRVWNRARCDGCRYRHRRAQKNAYTCGPRPAEAICGCGLRFNPHPSTKGPPRTRCDTCRRETRKAARRAWGKTPAGKESRNRSLRRKERRRRN